MGLDIKIRKKEESSSFTYYLAANQSLDWISSLNLSMVEYHIDTGNYFRDISRLEGKELNTYQKKKGKRKSTGQESLGVISLTPVAVGWIPLKANSSVVVHGWSIRRKWKYFQRWEPWSKLIFLFPEWGPYLMTITYDCRSLEVKLFWTPFDALECSLPFQW